jgi:hypothetical protein
LYILKHFETFLNISTHLCENKEPCLAILIFTSSTYGRKEDYRIIQPLWNKTWLCQWPCQWPWQWPLIILLSKKQLNGYLQCFKVAKKVCPVNLRGEVCTASNCGNKHPKICLVADHSKGKIPKSTCSLWHMRVPFAGSAGAGNVANVTGRRNGPNLPPGSKGSKAKVQPAKPDTKLAKLEATAMAEELKARIRAAKMMSQGVPYSQVVQAQAPVYVAPAQALAPAPAPALDPPLHRPDCSHSGQSYCDIP